MAKVLAIAVVFCLLTKVAVGQILGGKVTRNDDTVHNQDEVTNNNQDMNNLGNEAESRSASKLAAHTESRTASRTQTTATHISGK